MVNSIFVQKGDFAGVTKLTATPSFQLETIAASKVITANGSPPYDVSDHGEAEVVMMQEAGRLLPYDPALVSNLPDIYPSAKMGDFYASTNLLLFGLVWNTKEVAKAPTSFEALLDPALKGRIGRAGFRLVRHVLAAWREQGARRQRGQYRSLASSFSADLFKKNGAVTVQNADHGRKLLDQGEVVMVPFWNGVCTQLQNRGLPVKFESVPGTLAIGTGFVILKGTPYEEAAQRFVNMTLDPKLQAEFAAWNDYPPTNRKAVLPPGSENIKVTDAQLANTVKLDWSKVVQHKAQYLKRWNEEVLG